MKYLYTIEKYLYTIERFAECISKAEIVKEINSSFLVKNSSSKTGVRMIPKDCNSFTDLETAITQRNARERERLALLRKDCAEQQARVNNIPAWILQQRKELA